MGLLSKIFSNTRKPEGFWGRMMVAGMNGGSHAAMASWGLGLVNIPTEGEIIDIGCGGGANLARLMDRGLHANVTGVGLLIREGYDVSFRDFAKIGVPFTLSAVCVSYLYLWLVWS